MRKIFIFLMFLSLFSLSSAVVAEEDSITRAYKREYTYLVNQKKALEAELKKLEEQLKQISDRNNQQIVELENRILAVRGQAEALESKLVEINTELAKVEDTKQMVPATIQQAIETLSSNGYKDVPQSTDQSQTLRNIFNTAINLLKDRTSISVTKGEFFLQDGMKTSGEIISVGGVAKYGVSSDGKLGFLIPIGDGNFGLWQPEDKKLLEQTINGLKAGSIPSNMAVFLFENPMNPVEPPKERTLLEHIESGGVIGYIIIGLGLLGVILMILRGMILMSASKNTTEVTENAANMIKQGKLQDAVDYLSSTRGVVPSVLAYVIKNINLKDKENIEYVISEAILRYSPALDRFKVAIVVIAAVSPLLGLLGTVTGIIETFNVITEFGTGDPKLMAGGISEALVTTELGLIVAIPTYIAGSLLNGWAERIKEYIEESVLKVLNQFNQ